MLNRKKFTAKQKLKRLQLWEKHGYAEWYIEVLETQYRVSRASMYLWRSQYDGTLESLENKDPTPKTPHPNQMTKKERDIIEQIIKDNPTFGYLELYGEARQNFAYSRHYLTFYKFAHNHCTKPVTVYNKYIAKPYDTPIMLGTKMQMDVKEVPIICYTGEVKYWYEGKRKKFYQWTMIDEATREVFVYAYDRHNAESTKDFIARAITYFGYIPEIIQTDNGKEFTNKYTYKAKDKGNHIADKTMYHFGITHKLIRPATPRHNGKVERLHRTSQETFYNHLTFANLIDLNTQLACWMNRYNNRPHTALLNQFGKQKFQSPLDKRVELLELLKQQLATGIMPTITSKHKDGKLTTQRVVLPLVRWYAT